MKYNDFLILVAATLEPFVMRQLLSMIIAASIFNAAAAEKFSADKILQISVDEIGTVSIGRDTIGADNLALYIQDRLFKSYLGTGQMQNKIKISKTGDHVPDMVVQVVLKEIYEGQKMALKKLCLEKYKNLFENISLKKQDKLKQQFPVLFQTDYL
jgi:hypothetical protein